MSETIDLIYDPGVAETLRNPHLLFRQLREQDPVHWSEPMSGWILTKYKDVTQMLTDSSIFSAERLAAVRKHLPESAQSAANEILRWLSHWMVFQDPPDHTRLRRHMGRVLNLPVFETVRGSVQAIVDMLLDQLPRGETIDFLQGFAVQLPGMVIMDLLGVDRSRMLEVKSWSDDMMLFIGSARGVADKYERARRGAVAMGTLFRELVEKRRAENTGDLLSQLVHSKIDGRGMTDDELIGSMMMVLNGGHETTANLLNNAMMALCAHPEQADVLREGKASYGSAVEEFLRYDSPILSIGRIVTADTEFGGKQFTKGERVFAMLLSANRDIEIFANPDQMDVARNPNPHMAFGKGPHFCLGAPLARIEGQIAIKSILERFGKIELQCDLDAVPWINSVVTRGPTRLPLRLW